MLGGFGKRGDGVRYAGSWDSIRLWYDEPNAISNAVGYAMHYSRSHGAAIRVYDDAGNAIETHPHKGDFKDCG